MNVESNLCDFDRLFPMAKNFDIDFQGTKFAVPNDNLINLFEHQRGLIDATGYKVQSPVPLDIFRVFVKALETGGKVPVTKENASAISLLAREFWLEELVSECSAVMSTSPAALITALSERIGKLESQVSAYRSTITKLSDRVTKLGNQVSPRHSALIPEMYESIARLEHQQELLFSVFRATGHSGGVTNLESQPPHLHSTSKPAQSPTPVPVSPSPTPVPIPSISPSVATRPVPSVSPSPTKGPIPSVSPSATPRPGPPVSPSKPPNAVKIPLKQDNPKNGIISYLTRKHGGNVHDKGIVAITSKSVVNNDLDNAVRNLGDPTSDLSFLSAGGPGQWVCWDFRKLRVCPTHYTVGSPWLKSWVVEHSLDGSTWAEIDRRTNTNAGSFVVSNSAECRFIRLTVTGKDQWGNSDLYITAFEIFGTLLE
jgi:uncharacterized coiled-coil protein SlyX